jgi:hypothetical protein
MAISILNNIASIAAQNQLSITNSSLNTALLQLSSGSRINTGADDAAGLAVADGLQANVTALTQSARNASDGVGNLQVADGSLAQVTTLLNRAVTLATEASTGTISNTQRTALDTEFTAIKAEIDSIGANTNYNGTQVFNAAPLNIFLSDSGSSSTISTTTGALSSLGIGLGANANNTLSAIANPTVGKTVVLGEHCGSRRKDRSHTRKSRGRHQRQRGRGSCLRGRNHGECISNSCRRRIHHYVHFYCFWRWRRRTTRNRKLDRFHNERCQPGFQQWRHVYGRRGNRRTHHRRICAGCSHHHQFGDSDRRRNSRYSWRQRQPAPGCRQRHQQPGAEPHRCRRQHPRG